MAWIRTTGIAILALISAAADAEAQTPDPGQQAAATTTELVEKLSMFAGVLGIDTPPFPTDVMSQALEAALPVLPAGDGRDWDTTVAFDFTSDVSAGALEPDEGGRTVLTDARGCSAAGEPVDVVHFTRFTRGAVRGHRCVIMARADESAALQSLTFAEGPDRRLAVYYGVAIAVDGAPDEARRLLEERLDQNVALAETLADHAVEMFLRSQAGAAADGEAFEVRMARLAERLAEIAASFETPAPPPVP